MERNIIGMEDIISIYRLTIDVEYEGGGVP